MLDHNLPTVGCALAEHRGEKIDELLTILCYQHEKSSEPGNEEVIEKRKMYIFRVNASIDFNCSSYSEVQNCKCLIETFRMFVATV